MDGATWDLKRPLEGDCKLELLDFEDPDGKDVRALAVGPCKPCNAHACCCTSVAEPASARARALTSPFLVELVRANCKVR